MDDREIIELFLHRNSSAIDKSDCKYGSMLHATAYHILYNQEDSEECVNDTYYSAWNSIPPTVPQSLGAYLTSIVRNLSISRLRKRFADRRGKGEYALAYEELSEAIAADGEPDEEYEVRELVETINRFLSALKADDRRIFVRRYWLMEPIRDIAVQYAMTESRVKSSLFRSRNALRKCLTREGYL